MTAQNRFYRPISEQDTQAGYVDIFLYPLLDIYSDMKHSYIVELKYAKYKDPESRVEELRLEAIAQANRYADTDTVKKSSQALHSFIRLWLCTKEWICRYVKRFNTKKELALQAHHAKKSFKRAYDYPVWKLYAKVVSQYDARMNIFISSLIFSPSNSLIQLNKYCYFHSHRTVIDVPMYLYL